MINHFRTLILNRPPLEGTGGRFSHYVSSRFRPMTLDGPEASFRRAIFGESDARDRDEILSTILFRLIVDFDNTRQIAEGIDRRLTFNPRDPILAQFDDGNGGTIFIPANVLTLGGENLTLDGVDLTLGISDPNSGEYITLGDPLPVFPTVAQMWSRVGNSSGFRALFTHQGPHEDTLTELSRLIDTLKRDDHRLAVAACAYSLRLTSRI